MLHVKCTDAANGETVLRVDQWTTFPVRQGQREAEIRILELVIYVFGFLPSFSNFPVFMFFPSFCTAGSAIF